MPTYRDKVLYLWGLKRSDAFVVQNRTQQDMLSRYFGKTSTIINNGLPPADRISRSEGFVLWVGSMRKVKNPMMFVELARRNPESRFVMVGGNPLQRDAFYDEVSAEIRKVPNLQYLGFLPFGEVEKLFERASLFVNTSTIEGFPNTFLQAWCRGVPVVSTTSVNPDDLITKHNLGAVVENIDEMAEAVRRHQNGGLGVRPEEIKKFFDENLTINATVDRMEKVLSAMWGAA
jgi:glycosyltransferase involved in cell wall biosynthesis